MFQNYRLFAVLLMLALVNAHPFAQSAASSLSPSQQQAVAVLKQLYDECKEFGDDKLRIETQAEIAHLLWPYETTKARLYFTETYKTIEQIEDDEPLVPMLESPNLRMRREVLWRVMVRDSELAERLIQAISSRGNKSALDEDKRKLYLGLATYLISKDTKRATRIIQSNLDGAITMELVRTLNMVRQKEPAIADELLQQWLLKLQIHTEAPLNDLFILIQYFNSPEVMAGSKDAHRNAFEMSEALRESLLDFAFKVVTLYGEQEKKLSADPPHKRFVMGDMINVGIIASLVPLFEKYRPEQAGIIRAHLGQAENTLPNNIRNGEPSSPSKTVDDLLNEAQKQELPFLQDSLYHLAAHQAEQSGDYDRAIAIAGKIRDPGRRPNLSLMRELATYNAIEKGNLSEAYRFAKDLPDVSDRAKLFSQIALKAYEQSEIQRANELLSAAEKLIPKTAGTYEQVSALLQVTSTKAAMNWGQAFESAKAAVEAINNLYAQGAAKRGMDYFQNTDAFQKNLGALANHDFQRALSLAQAIKNKEVSVNAQLSVCASVLVEKTIERKK